MSFMTISVSPWIYNNLAKLNSRPHGCVPEGIFAAQVLSCLVAWSTLRRSSQGSCARGTEEREVAIRREHSFDAWTFASPVLAPRSRSRSRSAPTGHGTPVAVQSSKRPSTAPAATNIVVATKLARGPSSFGRTAGAARDRHDRFDAQIKTKVYIVEQANCFQYPGGHEVLRSGH